jgi:hypothetical protein
MIKNYSEPELKLGSKNIPFAAILKPSNNVSQSRKVTLDTNHVRKLERGITAVGLEEPLRVEIAHWDPNDITRSTFTLRDGNHRYEAIFNLAKRFPTAWKYVPCAVYEKHVSPTAESDWLLWQHDENEFLDKIHLKNSFDDKVHIVSRLLIDGALWPIAAAHIAQNNWDHHSVEDALREFIKDHCKGYQKAKQDELVNAVFKSHGQTLHHSIKRYSTREYTNVLKTQFRVFNSGCLSEDGTKRVWVINNNDWDKQINRPLRTLIDSVSGVKNVTNILIFHSKQTDPDAIIKLRRTVKDKVAKQNQWYGNNVKGTKNGSIIDELYFLGQLTKLKNNPETAFQLIKA